MNTLTLLMILEDDPTSLYLLERYLRRSIYRVISTTRGEDALALARQENPTMILLDALLSGMSGWDVLQALKADPVTCFIPVIICSEQDEADRAREAGATAFLRKPYSPDDLWGALGGGADMPVR